MGNTSDISVSEITSARGIEDWLAVPKLVFANDPCWVPPLRMAERERISPRHSAFFAAGEAAFFVAYRDHRPVGRISAQINKRHVEHYGQRTGHFGFFDCVDDIDAAQALVEAADAWLRKRSMAKMVGPFNLTINEDAGLLIEGFDTPPAVLTSHAPPWAGALLEHCGMAKVVDLLAYRIRPADAPPELDRLAKLAKRSGRVRIRSLDMKRYADEVALIFDIFNDAWRDNWGFVPVSDAEVATLARDTRAIMRSKFGRIVEIDGEPAAMMVVLPDLNRVIAPFDGRLLPFNWARMAYAIWADKWKTARIPLLGIRTRHRATPLATLVLSLLVSEFVELGRAYDLDWIEFSWVLETNAPMVKLGQLTAGPPVKRYRVYERKIAPM